MTKLLFAFFSAFSWCIARAPKFIMYGIADILYVLTYYLIGYRKKVVFENLQRAFPEKDQKARIKIAKKFYRHLADIVVEDLAMFRMSSKRVKTFVNFHNIELLQEEAYKDRDIITTLGHYGNWEFMVTLPLFYSLKIVSVYKPLSNKFFDKEVRAMRERFGGDTATMQNTLRVALQLHKSSERFAMGLLSDQRPQKAHSKYWLPFLNQETAILPGPDKIARKIDALVIFANIQKTRRGHYDIHLELLTDRPGDLPADEISKMHTKRLEEIIKENPEYWLWSHKRWKYKKEECM
jgi:KDO2-lipid IV(A) lauroyltransferase